MKTFLIDLHGRLAGLGSAVPLLYPYFEEGGLEFLPAPGQPRDLRELAESVRVSVLRDYRPRVQLLFLVDLGKGGLVEQVGRIRDEFLETLAGYGLFPSRLLVLTVDELAREPHTGAPETSPAKAHWERDVQALADKPARLAGGPEERPPPLLAGTLVLRFPLRRVPAPAFQQQLVQLVYLIAVLVELFQGDEEIGQERLFKVDEVALDPTEVRAWLADYEECLAQARRGVAHQLEHPEPVTVGLIENPNCGCSGVLEPPELAEERFGWLRHADDFGVWRRWWQDTGRRLAGHADAGEGLVRRCMREWRTRVFEPTERVVDAIADLAAELHQRLDQARRALARGSHVREQEPDWDDDMQRLTPQVHARIEARPRLRAFVLFTAALLPLLVAPTLLTLPPTGAGAWLGTALLVLGASGAVAWWVLAVLRKRLRNELHRALERAREISKQVSERVERRKRHLSALCAVEVARRNDAQAQEALRRAGRRMLLLKYHRDSLDKHLTLAQAFAKHHALERPAAAPPGSGVGGASGLAVGWRVELPPVQNPVYAPALCTGSLHEQVYEVRVRAGARVIRRASGRLRGLQHLQLAHDIIYPASRERSADPLDAGDDEATRRDRA